jgi:hypothetical protein
MKLVFNKQGTTEHEETETGTSMTNIGKNLETRIRLPVSTVVKSDIIPPNFHIRNPQSKIKVTLKQQIC